MTALILFGFDSLSFVDLLYTYVQNWGVWAAWILHRAVIGEMTPGLELEAGEAGVSVAKSS